MNIKICGIRRTEDVRFLNESLPDFTGFVFADTRRKVSREQATVLYRMLDRRIKVFGVFVNAPAEFIKGLAKEGVIDAIQLHGDETEEDIISLKRETGLPVIKAVRARDSESILQADHLSCDYLLLDTYRAGQYGGTGETFSWDMIPEKLEHPYFLAGGLHAQNLKCAMDHVSGRGICLGVDVSGGVETNGYKDKEKIKRVVEIVRSYTPAVSKHFI